LNAYFAMDHTNSKAKCTDDDIVNMINFLIDNIPANYRHSYGTNCAPFLADIYLHS